MTALTLILILTAALLVIALTVAFFAVLRWCYRKAFAHTDRQKARPLQDVLSDVKDEIAYLPMCRLVADLENEPYERVTIRSRDGLTLSARYYHFSEDENRLEILFHGWRSNALRDGCGGAKLARDGKYNLLMVDQRAHGESEGNTVTFGILEKYDCLDWVHYAISRFGSDVRILLGGVSMGAATVLMASALPLPPNVKAITADCGYSSPEAIIRKVCRDMGIPDKLGYPFVRMSARILGHFSLCDGGAVEAVKKATLPIMLMHGEQDDFVPFSMCGEIRDACASPCEVYTDANAGHGLCYFYNTEAYVAAVGAFKAKYLSEDTPDTV